MKLNNDNKHFMLHIEKHCGHGALSCWKRDTVDCIIIFHRFSSFFVLALGGLMNSN